MNIRFWIILGVIINARNLHAQNPFFTSNGVNAAGFNYALKSCMLDTLKNVYVLGIAHHTWYNQLKGIGESGAFGIIKRPTNALLIKWSTTGTTWINEHLMELKIHQLISKKTLLFTGISPHFFRFPNHHHWQFSASIGVCYRVSNNAIIGFSEIFPIGFSSLWRHESYLLIKTKYGAAEFIAANTSPKLNGAFIYSFKQHKAMSIRLGFSQSPSKIFCQWKIQKKHGVAEIGFSYVPFLGNQLGVAAHVIK